MPQPPSRRALAALTLITLLALALRWPAVHRMLPHNPEPDAFLVLHAQEMDGDPSLPVGWEFSERYPTLFTRLLASIPRREPSPNLTASALEQDDLACAASPYFHGRTVILLLSILVIPLTWIVARRFAPPATALLAAWLIATSSLHALFSTQARPHGAEATLCLLAVWGALRIVEQPTVLRILIGALLSSLAISGLQSGLFTLFPLFIALLIAPGSPRARTLRAVLVPALSLASAFWAYPVLPHIDSTGVHLGGAGGHEFFFSQLNFHGLAVATTLLFGHDPFLLVTTLFALTLAIGWLVRNFSDLLRGRRPSIAVALAYVLPYFALICVSEEIYERFLLPLLPWCAILSAWAWRPFFDIDRPSRALASTVRAFALLSLLLPLIPLIQFSLVSARPDSLEQASTWIRAHIPVQDSVVGNPYLSPPLRFDPTTLDSLRSDGSAISNVWIAWQMAHPQSESGLRLTPLPAPIARAPDTDPRLDAWLQEKAPRWVILEISRRMDQVPAVRRLHAWADDHGTVVYDSMGTAPDVLEKGLIDYQSIIDFVPRLMRTRVFGPPMRIWKITR